MARSGLQHKVDGWNKYTFGRGKQNKILFQIM